MAEGERLYAVLAEFSKAEALLEGARQLHEAGFRNVEAFTPFPIDGLAETLGFDDQGVPRATLIGGVFGFIAGFLLQVWANLDYPLDIGGRPLVPPQAFMLISFETLVLCAVISAVASMLWRNGLPRLHHPLFDNERFHLASDDRFFLAIMAEPDMDREAARAALERLHPVTLTDVFERSLS